MAFGKAREGGERMPIFVILGNFTSKGVETLKETRKGQENAQKLVEAAGGKVLGLYYTMGRYDWVSIVEGPSIEIAMKTLMMFGMGGRNRTETLVAVSADKALKLIDEIP